MRPVIISILMLFACCGAWAQQHVSFDEAMSLALEHSDVIKGQNRDMATAMYERQAAKGLYFPKVEITGAYLLTDRDIDININSKKGVVENSAAALISQGVTVGLLSPEVAQLLRGAISPLLNLDWRYTIQKRSFGVIAAKVSMPLYAGGRIRVANRVASLKLSMEEHRMDTATGELLITLVEQYYGVVLLQYAVDVRRGVVDAVRAHLEDAKAMEEAGEIAHSVVLEVEFKLAEAERDLLSESHKLAMARRALKATMNVVFEPVPSDRLFIYKNILSLDYYVDNALNLNSELRAAELNLDLAKEGVKAARADMLPTVGIMGEGSLYRHNLTTLLPRWVIGVEANVLLFNGLNKMQMLKAAKSRLEGVGAKIEKARSDISLFAEQQYYNVINSLADIDAAKSSMALADSYYMSTYESYKAGVATASQLLDAEVARAASVLSYLNVAYNHCMALVRLLRASGLSHMFDECRCNGEQLML